MTALPSLREIAARLGGEVSGKSVLAPGPNHQPGDRSLQVTQSTILSDGFVVHSFAGDDAIKCKDYVRQKLGLPQWKPNGGNDKQEPIATYPYVAEQGELLFEVLRFASKKFLQRRPDGNGWSWKLDGVRRVLYRLPEITEAIALGQTIFVAEGEKAVEALVAIGVQATCSPSGAGKWRDEYNQHLRSADVVILPDNDEPGELHAKAVAKSLAGIASRVRALRLPGIPPKGDPYDWIESGGTAEQLWGLIEEIKDDGVEEKPKERPGLIWRHASEIELEPIVWLWPSRIAKGKHTCIAGDPGTGKSQLAIVIIAAITTGGEWPCGEGRAPLGSVIILSAEDGAGDTILPRLHAAGADCGRVYIVDAVREENGDERTFNLKSDLAALEKMIVERGDVSFVVIDTVNSYLGKTDSHKNAEVRAVLDPLSKMAERMRVAVLSITHFSKGGSSSTTKALHRFLGSIGFVGSPRAAFATFEDPDDPDRRLFLHAKNNLAAPPQGLAYRLEQTIVGEGIVASRVKWEPNPVTITANEALAADAASDGNRSVLGEAEEFLRDLLSAGPVAAKEVKTEATSAGLAWASLRRAKEKMGIKPRRDGFQDGASWVWELPKVLNSPEDAQP